MINLLLALNLAADCPRTPVARVPRRDNTSSPRETAHLNALSRAMRVAYPDYQLVIADSLYVTVGGKTYRVDIAFENDEDSGFAALAFSFSSQQSAAVDALSSVSSRGCRAPTELVFFRDTKGAAPIILARSQIDNEAVSIDIRTMDFDVEGREPQASFLYFAYYHGPGWFGFVGFNSTVWIENGRFTATRVPRSYLKLTGPDKRRMEGYLATVGAHNGLVRIEVAAFGAQGEVNTQVDVPLVQQRWMSGADILQRVP